MLKSYCLFVARANELRMWSQGYMPDWKLMPDLGTINILLQQKDWVGGSEPGFESSICYSHNKCSSQYYLYKNERMFCFSV